MESDLLKRIEALEKELKELKKDNLNMFGRSYNQIGSSTSDLLLKTRGLVKIQYGSKFIDLIKNGKINVDSEFIYKSDSLGTKNGIYLIKDEIYLVIDGFSILLSKGEGSTYVSFLSPQETTSENKLTALTNIGFIYPNILSVNENALQNGIIYIESELKLYIINNGNLKEYTINIPNSINSSFTIEDGSLIIKGEGTSNALTFNDLLIYNNNISSKSELKINCSLLLVTGDTIFNNNVISNNVQSKSYTKTSGFRLYEINGTSILTVDKIVERTKENNSELIYSNSENMIESINKSEEGNVYINFNSDCEIGDVFYVPSKKVLITIIDKVDNLGYSISELEIDYDSLVGKLCYKNNRLLRIKGSDIDILNYNEDLSENILIHIGDILTSQSCDFNNVSINELSTGNAIIENLECNSILNNEELSNDENSNKVATTKWVQNLISNLII